MTELLPVSVTRLHLASYQNDFETVKHCIEQGANINIRTSKGTTPLMFATQCEFSAIEIVKLLIKKGATINTSNKQGYTPLLYAATRCSDIVELLLDKKGSN